MVFSSELLRISVAQLNFTDASKGIFLVIEATFEVK